MKVLYIMGLVLLHYNFLIPSHLPLLSHQQRVKQSVEREFGGPDRYEEHQRALVLKFFQDRIAFETEVEKRRKLLEQPREQKKYIVTENLEHIYRLAQPKAVVEGPIVLPLLISKKLTEREKGNLFARLAEPKDRTPRYEESIIRRKNLGKEKVKK
jgi:hypothetical protein